MTSITEPLTPGQQMFLQRLMAANVLSHEEAEALFQELNDDDNCTSVETCFRTINEQLMAGFGLEIATVVLADRQKYHSVINPHADDDIAKSSYKGALPASEREYIRKVLETLVQDEEATSRMQLINIRTGLDEKYRMTVAEIEHCLDRMHREGWLSLAEGDENRRQSLKTEYAIGPRSYLELRHLLQSFGLEDPPQCIYHRAV